MSQGGLLLVLETWRIFPVFAVDVAFLFSYQVEARIEDWQSEFSVRSCWSLVTRWILSLWTQA